MLLLIATGVEANPTQKLDDTIVLLRHGTVTVTEADFQAELQRIPEQHRGAFMTSSERIRKLLANLFVRKILAQEAREANLDQDSLVKKRSELAVDQLLAEVRLEHLVEEEPQPDYEALAREKYLANPEQFQVPEQVRVSHILISTDKQSEAEARARAEEVLKQVKEGSTPFAELAVEYSQDPSVQRNKGDLGYIAKGQTAKPFEEAAFAMSKPGEISPIVKTQYGFHIIRFEDRKPAHQKSFADVKNELISTVTKEQQERLKAFHLGRIRTMDGIQANEEAIEALKIPVDWKEESTPNTAQTQ